MDSSIAEELIMVMVNSSEQLKLNFNYADQCKAITQDIFGVIHPSELNYIDRPCTGVGHNIIDCKIPNLQVHYNDISGLSFDTVVSNGKTPAKLPYYIPILSRRLSSCKISYDILGVTLKDIFTRDPIDKHFGVNMCRKTLRLKHNLFEQAGLKGKNLILFSSGQDCLIEEIWKRQEFLNYYTELYKIGFDVATSINFSLFLGECPLSHSLNLKKSLITFEYMQQVGLPCIPHVYWTNRNHLSRWVKWLNDNPDINNISYNCQLCNDEFLPVVNNGIHYILHQIPRLHILLEGPSRKLLSKLKDVSHSIHIATKWPSECAVNYRKFYNKDGKWILTKGDQSSIDLLLENNYRQFQIYLEDNFYEQKMPSFAIVSRPLEKIRTSRFKKYQPNLSIIE